MLTTCLKTRDDGNLVVGSSGCFCTGVDADGVIYVLFCSHRNIYVVVVPLRRSRGVIRHHKSPDEMDLDEVRTTTMKAQC